MIAVDDELRSYGQANFTHGFFKSISAHDCRSQSGRPAYESDLLMPQGRQVLHRLPNPIGIIDTNITDARRFRPDVNEHQRQVPEAEVFQQLVFHTEGKNSDAVDASFDHPANGKFHALWIMNGGGQQNLIILRDREGLKRLHDLWEKRVGNFRNDQSEHPALAGN